MSPMQNVVALVTLHCVGPGPQSCLGSRGPAEGRRDAVVVNHATDIP
jgi:hypothetical protein